MRRRIDDVDCAILEQLNLRAEIVLEVGSLKAEQDAAVYRAGRERDLVAKLSEANAGPFPHEGIAPVFREVISATRSLESRLRIAYLGPEGTYSHLAARQQFGHCVEYVSASAISEIFRLVERGGADLGVVPVENTTEGAVTPSLDALVDSKVALCGEIIVPVTHQLLSKSGRREDIQQVASHTQPLGQCREWLEMHLPGIPRMETASTVVAAQRAAADESLAAIGSSVAAEVYGLKVVEANIQDRGDNTTRFVIVGNDSPASTGHDLTSVVYTIRRDESGALHRLIEPFARHGVTLTAIHSRPIRGHHWEYHFFLDLEGHPSEENVAIALREAATCADSYRILGSFPRAQASAREATEGDAS
ncbi:MAG: prephenate dehydratase [Deltaproteobacteria bacterium]|nr:prephenate dehydratase [Deltaproteobacteria bacterium]